MTTNVYRKTLIELDRAESDAKDSPVLECGIRVYAADNAARGFRSFRLLNSWFACTIIGSPSSRH